MEHLGAAGLVREGRVAVEKPFGRDLASARELDARLHRLLREGQILRVDHFLGRSRSSSWNTCGSPTWRWPSCGSARAFRPCRSRWPRTSASSRGRFYDSVGALRNVVQNHLLQVLALVAMDPPAGGSAGDTPSKKAEVFRAMPPADPQHYVRGQYQGYADVPGVASGSATKNLRRAAAGDRQLALGGRPRLPAQAGKALPHRVTKVRLLLRRTPRLAFLPPADQSRA